MAEGEGDWWGGWFQQSFQSVKEKSVEAFEFMKRDLTEFTHVVQHDTACTIAATASAVKEKLAAEGSSQTTEKVKKGLSTILGVITDTLAPPPDKTIDCDVITLIATPTGTTEVYDSAKARLYSLQADPATYCNEPDGPAEVFDAWLQEFNLEQKKGEISDLLVNSSSIRALYTKMVPAAVSHVEFWQRYFFKVYQLFQEEVRRKALKQRAENTSHSEELGWEEEEDEYGNTSSQLHFKPSDESLTSSEKRSTPEELALFSSVTAKTPTSDNTDFSNITGENEMTPSVSSESVTLRTQIDILGIVPDNTTEDITKKLREATLEDADYSHSTQAPVERLSGESYKSDLIGQSSLQGGEKLDTAVEKLSIKNETLKEEGPTDLRVFELNSDSGKSTPSNNGKKGSSTDISEDWEKDIDLDMTEEEVQLALSNMEAFGELDEEDWKDWE
ncbi:BSD domain-containing protein 1 [Erpetoichthys calabaricus]|uniref:BSD domain containing 1 n=1 Tax=Erpetoichthys calabaricus TaxID=27687 RepID=A0A8C4T3C1_ERPCA|nr:BSD domain-containing protein 1 [Erpetoichthys calabaricus]